METELELELDRLSNLPNDVTGKILSHMPIKDAVRTSVLSSDWRYKSAELTSFVFDDESIATQHHTFANIVDHVLLRHFGSIYKFKLAAKHVPFTAIDRWVLHMSRSSIRVMIQGQQLYEVPSSMFSCHGLICLHLDKCLLQLPSTFTGFKSLKILKLFCVGLTQEVLETMIFHCSLPEKLSVDSCHGFNQFNIDAPNLQFLYYASVSEDINMLNTPKLVDVSINKRGQITSPCRSSNLLKFFAQLPNIHKLYINPWFLKYLGAGALLERLPQPCLHLQILTLRIFVDDMEDISTLLCILRSSPALENLKIWALSNQDFDAQEGKVKDWIHDHQSCSFTRLRHVNIRCFRGGEAALDFIRFLLASSPELETMMVCNDKRLPAIKNYDLAKKLLLFKRASVNSKIILDDK